MKTQKSQEWFQAERHIAETHTNHDVRKWAQAEIEYELNESRNTLIRPKMFGEEKSFGRGLYSLLDLGALLSSLMAIAVTLPTAKSLSEILALTASVSMVYIGSYALDKIDKEGLGIRQGKTVYDYWTSLEG